MMRSEDGTQILTIYYKLTRNEDGNVVSKVIIFDEELELSFVYSSDKQLPAKMYIEPIKGQLVRDTINTYIQKNGYQKALVLKQLSSGKKIMDNLDVVCDKASAKEAMNTIIRKFNDYAYDDRDSMTMCAKLSICIQIGRAHV